MEIQVGEYARTKGGHIRKVSKIIPCYENELLLSDTYYIEFDEKGDISTYKNKQVEEFITKHSPNIIDLIEEGDYVNGREVVYDASESELYNGHKTIDVSISNDNSTTWTILDTEIRDVVTKEQFNQMKYIVGDESSE